jgi:hypothetical protein
MINWRRVVIGLAPVFCLLGTLLLVEGVAPTLHPPTQTQTAGQRGDETTNKNGGKKPKESFWQRTTDDPVATFTAALTLFTAVLAGASSAQFYFLIKADKTTRIAADAATKAANAADLSARAAIALESPLLRVTPSTPVPLKEDATILCIPDARITGAPINQVTKRTIIDGLMIYNAGRTAATPLRVKFGSSVANQLEGQPFYMLDLAAEPQGLLPVGSGTMPNTVISNIEHIIVLSDAEVQQLQQPGGFLWVYAEISYLDFMDNRHDVRFCWRWERAGANGWRWVSRADVPTSYLRKPED